MVMHQMEVMEVMEMPTKALPEEPHFSVMSVQEQAKRPLLEDPRQTTVLREIRATMEERLCRSKWMTVEQALLEERRYWAT